MFLLLLLGVKFIRAEKVEDMSYLCPIVRNSAFSLETQAVLIVYTYLIYEKACCCCGGTNAAMYF